MEALQTLLDRTKGADLLTPELRVLYGGPLSIPEAPSGRPYVVVNFVYTIDGHTSYGSGYAGGGLVSAYNEQDTFIMGLLRTAADAVMVGANTLREEGEHLWTHTHIAKAFDAEMTAMRRELGKQRRYPLNTFVTGSGEVISGSAQAKLPAVFRHAEVEPIVFTTQSGQERVARDFTGVSAPQVYTFGNEAEVDLPMMLRYLRTEMNVKLLLVEGGERFAGALCKAGLYDEFFLTMSPFIVGQTRENPRPLIVSGFEFTPEQAPRHRLMSLKEHEDYVFSRWQRIVQ